MTPRREDLGSWLEGTPGGGRDRLGLPQQGRGSLAPTLRRVLGVSLDWTLASLISYRWFDWDVWATTGIFGLSTWLLVSTLGTTIGHRLVGVQVVRLRDVAVEPWRPPGFVPGLARTALLLLVIPAVVWDSSGRGLHDVAAGTAVVRR